MSNSTQKKQLKSKSALDRPPRPSSARTRPSDLKPIPNAPSSFRRDDDCQVFVIGDGSPQHLSDLKYYTANRTVYCFKRHRIVKLEVSDRGDLISRPIDSPIYAEVKEVPRNPAMEVVVHWVAPEPVKVYNEVAVEEVVPATVIPINLIDSLREDVEAVNDPYADAPPVQAAVNDGVGSPDVSILGPKAVFPNPNAPEFTDLGTRKVEDPVLTAKIKSKSTSSAATEQVIEPPTESKPNPTRETMTTDTEPSDRRPRKSNKYDRLDWTEAEIIARSVGNPVNGRYKVRCLNHAAHYRGDQRPSAYYYDASGYYACNKGSCGIEGIAKDKWKGSDRAPTKRLVKPTPPEPKVRLNVGVQVAPTLFEPDHKRTFLNQLVSKYYHDLGRQFYTVVQHLYYSDKLGKQTWTYVPKDADGNKIPVAKPFPLYSHHITKSIETIHIFEGEKCAYQFNKCDLFDSSTDFGTTSKGGSKSPHLTDWSPVIAAIQRGVKVVLWPDYDKDGEIYIEKVAQLLNLNKPTIRRVGRAGCKSGYDFADFLQDHH